MFTVPRIVPPTSSTIAHAADNLRAGGAVAFPTETVYGLGALTFNENGLDLVYGLKGRPPGNPLIAHVLDATQARMLVAPGAWDDRCERLTNEFWPGPLTLVLPKGARVPARATADLPTVAIRAPAHAVARRLIDAVGEPISAPSANRSGHVSPTTAQHVLDEFIDSDHQASRELLVIDGGACDVGLESTVLDLTRSPPRVLRPGSVTLEQLREALGVVDSAVIESQDSSPGTSLAHYAPRTPVQLVEAASLRAELDAHARAGRRCVALCFDASVIAPPHASIVVSNHPATYAHNLYRLLREADAQGSDQIVVEMPADSSHLWRAIRDRLSRAAARHR